MGLSSRCGWETGPIYINALVDRASSMSFAAGFSILATRTLLVPMSCAREVKGHLPRKGCEARGLGLVACTR